MMPLGWIKHTEGVQMGEDTKYYDLELIEGVEGKCISLNGVRIAGPKPWGIGRVILTFHVTAEDLRLAIPELTDE